MTAEDNKNLEQEEGTGGMHGLDELAQHFSHEAGDEAPAPPPLSAAMRGALRFLPPFFTEIAEKGVAFSMDGLTGNFLVEGFYRNGPMKLQVTETDDIKTIDKNGKEVLVRNYEDLMRLNYRWWVRSSTRTTYVSPNRPWINDYIKAGLVERKVIFVPNQKDDSDGSEGEE